MVYSNAAVLVYDAIATLARRRACATSHDMLIDYGTDREDIAPPSTRGD